MVRLLADWEWPKARKKIAQGKASGGRAPALSDALSQPTKTFPRVQDLADFQHQGNKGSEEFCFAPTSRRASKMKDGTDRAGFME
jgi:hypothetical protein